jgi:hypothetical protein
LIAGAGARIATGRGSNRVHGAQEFASAGPALVERRKRSVIVDDGNCYSFWKV